MSILRTSALIIGRLGRDIISNVLRKNVQTGGGSGLHAALAASKLARTALVGQTGRDFPSDILAALRTRVDTRGVVIDQERDCNLWVGEYDDLNRAKTRQYQTNIPERELTVPSELRQSATVFVAAMSPALQLKVIEQLGKSALIMVDTIRGFIKREKELVTQVFARADVVSLNREEAELYTGQSDPYLAMEQLLALGPKAVIIKLGSEGAIMGSGDLLFSLPAFNKKPVDTTGAGDAFGGAFIGYLAREKEKRLFLDQISFGEAFLMASVMAAYSVEDFGSLRLHSLTPQELFTKFLSSRAALPGTTDLTVAGKLNGNLLLDLFSHGGTAGEKVRSLTSEDYLPGTFPLDVVEGSRELNSFSLCREHKSETMLKLAAGNEGENTALFQRYLAELDKLDRSRLTYFTLAEAIFNLGRSAFGEQDPFAATNAQAHQLGQEITRSLPTDLTTKEWLTVLAAANGVELYSLKPKFLAGVEALRAVVQNPAAAALTLDASEIFQQRVMAQPTKIAFLTDNYGEADLDLKFILMLAEHYEKISPAGNWQITMIPKSLPTQTDVTYSALLAMIGEKDSPLSGLQRFVQSGRVKLVADGSRGQGTNLNLLSSAAANALLEVQHSNGVVIGKGEAHAHILSGLEIDTFVIFKTKSKEMSLAAGVERNSLCVAYLPAGIRGIKEHNGVIQQSLADTQTALNELSQQRIALSAVKARMSQTGEPLIDAANLASSLPVLRGEQLAPYLQRLSRHPNLVDRLPIFVARAAQPFKLAWDELAEHASYPLLPKIGVVPRYSLAEMIAQFLTPTELQAPLSAELRQQLSPVIGPKATVGDALAALADIGLDQHCYTALEIFKALEAENDQRPQDRNPQLRHQIITLYSYLKGKTQHQVRPLLNALLATTSFAQLLRRQKVAFIDEAGSTGSTVIAAEFIVRAFVDEADWKFLTVQPTKITTGLFDGDCGQRFKPLENEPQLYDVIFVNGDQREEKRSLGQRYTYQAAAELLAAQPSPATAALSASESGLQEFIGRHSSQLLAGIRHLNSRQALAIAKMLLRQAQAGAAPLARLISTIAQIAVYEELVPNHTRHQFAIMGELELLAKRLSPLLEQAPELAKLDQTLAPYESLQAVQRWQQRYARYVAAIIAGVETL